jgi:hypothetical protein
MADVLYSFTLHKGSRDSRDPAKLMRFRSTYVVRTPGLINVQQANNVASWLVFAERVLTCNSIGFGRVVAIQLHADKGYDAQTPTFTFVPGTFDRYRDSTMLPGLRYGPYVPFSQKLCVRQTRRFGPRWSKWLEGSGGPDDVFIFANDYAHTGKGGLKMGGPGSKYCFDWYRWALEQAGVVDFSVEVDQLGNYTEHGQPVGPPLPGVLSSFKKLALWFQQRPTSIGALDWTFTQADYLLCMGMLAYNRTLGDTANFFDGYIYPDIRAALTEISRAAAMWQNFAYLLGYNTPSGALLGDYRDYLITEHLDNVARGSLAVEDANKAVVFELVNQLYKSSQWFEENLFIGPEDFGFKSDLIFSYPFARWKESKTQTLFDRWDEITQFIFDVQDAINLLAQLLRLKTKRKYLRRDEFRKYASFLTGRGYAPSFPAWLELMPYEVVVARPRGFWFNKPSDPLPTNRAVVEIPTTPAEPARRAPPRDYKSPFELETGHPYDASNPSDYFKMHTDEWMKGYPDRGLVGNIRALRNMNNGNLSSDPQA